MRAITARVILLLGIQLLATCAFAQTSLRFFGNAIPNVNRVMIRVDPHVPADVGASDFTLEFWMKASAAQNTPSTTCNPGGGENWITGNIIFDRAIWQHDQHGDYGISIFRNGTRSTLAFGVFKGGSTGQGICGGIDVGDNTWHHVAVTRAVASGQMRIFVDGVLDAEGTGPIGNISYADGVPSQIPPGLSVLNVDNYLGIGAEKFDADGTRYPSYSGFVDEVRISTILRYSGNFARPTQPFAADGNTAALYHFDEGSGDAINDSAQGGASPGVRHFGGNPAGPAWSSDTPFAAGAGTLRFTASNFSSAESAASATISVERVNGTAGMVTVNYAAASDTAIAPGDFAATSDMLDWPNGDGAVKTFAVAIANDALVEGNETVALSLSAPTGGAALGTIPNATLTIVDDDSASSPGSLQFSAATFDVAEGAASASIAVTRTGGSAGSVSVVCATTNGSAVAPADYATTSQVLSWNAGDTAAKPFTVAIADDVLGEGQETVNLTLSSASGGAVIGVPGTATLRITDNDVAQPGVLQIEQGSYSVNENAGALLVRVTRTGGSTGAVGVRVATAPGTATAGADFTSSSSVLTWAAGDAAAKEVSIAILDDTTDDDNETFALGLSAASGGAALGAVATSSITIVDNDSGGGNSGSGGGAVGIGLLIALFALGLRRLHLRRLPG